MGKVVKNEAKVSSSPEEKMRSPNSVMPSLFATIESPAVEDQQQLERPLPDGLREAALQQGHRERAGQREGEGQGDGEARSYDRPRSQKGTQDSWTSSKLDGSIVPSARGRRGSVKVTLTADEHAEAAEIYTFPNTTGDVDGSMRVVLLPHEHTLFCERKERVCLSHGKLQEHERVSVQKGGSEIDTDDYREYCWYRSTANNIKKHTSGAMPERHKIVSALQEATFGRIEGTSGKKSYQLTQDDVDCFLKFAPDGERGGEESADIVGPVLPAPPRLTKISVIGNLVPGGYAIADAHYTGGCQGSSEFWWLKICQGERQPLGEAEAVDANRTTAELVELAQQDNAEAKEILDKDPRVVLVQDKDVGSIFKVKCRPVRSDGYRGEIFTSKPSIEVKLEAAQGTIKG